MKNQTLLILNVAAGLALLPFSAVRAQEDRQPADHQLKISYEGGFDDETNLLSARKTVKRVGKHVVWKIHEAGSGPAFTNFLIKGNQLIKWKCDDIGFSLVFSNRADWLDAASNPPAWRTNVYGTSVNTNIGIIDSISNATTGLNVVTLRFWPQPKQTNNYAYRIFVPPIATNNFAADKSDPQPLLWPYGYYNDMVEASLCWDGSFEIK